MIVSASHLHAQDGFTRCPATPHLQIAQKLSPETIESYSAQPPATLDKMTSITDFDPLEILLEGRKTFLLSRSLHRTLTLQMGRVRSIAHASTWSVGNGVTVTEEGRIGDTLNQQCFRDWLLICQGYYRQSIRAYRKSDQRLVTVEVDPTLAKCRGYLTSFRTVSWIRYSRFIIVPSARHPNSGTCRV